jgi:hypothetical protein
VQQRIKLARPTVSYQTRTKQGTTLELSTEVVDKMRVPHFHQQQNVANAYNDDVDKTRVWCPAA